MAFRIELLVPLRHETPLGAIVPSMRDLMAVLHVGRFVDGLPPRPQLVKGLWQYKETGVWFDTASKTLTILVDQTRDLQSLDPLDTFCRAMEPLSRTGFHYRASDASNDPAADHIDVIFGQTPADRLVEQRRIRVECAMTVLTGGDPNYNYSLLRETLRGLLGVSDDDVDDDRDIEHIDMQALEAEVTGLGAGLP